jgi:ABC-type bacteriocin/lantibiotic exporter with double-glycine peptidase domain
VLVDGQDIAIIDTTFLRHQIGMVLQENMLFNRSIRDNIALSNPALSIEAIIEAAKLAGAQPAITLTKVDLPAPLSPISPSTSPASSAMSTSFSA